MIKPFGRSIYKLDQYIFKCNRILGPFSISNDSVQTRSLSQDNMENKKKETFMIVGLGNHDMPKTRHSVGMALVNKLAGFLGITPVKDRNCLGFVAEKELSNIRIVLLKPKLAMNLNGRSVQKTASMYHVPRCNVYLVHDDLDRTVGKVSIKEKGSAGGHNGVRSAIQCLKSEDMPRLRIGIDRPVRQDMVGDYVLQKFSSKEQAVIDNTLDQGILQLAQHIGVRLSLTPAQVFNARTDTSISTNGALREKNDIT